MNKKCLFLFDRFGFRGVVGNDWNFIYGCVADDEAGLMEMARNIAGRICTRIHITPAEERDKLTLEILEDLKSLDFTCLADDFHHHLESFGLLLVSSFKDLPR